MALYSSNPGLVACADALGLDCVDVHEKPVLLLKGVLQASHVVGGLVEAQCGVCTTAHKTSQAVPEPPVSSLESVSH